jgi:lipopolysaccharide export system permease protein
MLGDLLRVALLTTAVLVTVIAFGAAIKPLAREMLLTAGQTAKYIVLAIVPMLQFALPFAAGFAGTMSLHRMAEDNEIVAASVSGISYRRLLLPMVALGLALMLVMILLTQWVIPRFWGLLERAVARDITRLFQASIERGEPFQLGDLQIWADRLIVDPQPQGTDADTRLILFHVAAAVLDGEGRVDEDVTANQAVADIYRRPGATYIKLAMSEVVGFQPDSGTLVSTPRIEPADAIVIPSVLRDDARRMTRGELLALRENPDTYGPVIEAKVALAEALRDVELWRRLRARLADPGAGGGRVRFQAADPKRRSFFVHAEGLRSGRFSTENGRPVEVVEFDGASARRRMRCADVQLRRHATGPLDTVAFDLILTDCEVTDLQSPQTPNRRARIALENLTIDDVVVDSLAELPSDDLFARAENLGERAGGHTAARVRKLRHEIDALQREISGRLLKRYALSATALLLMMLGATLAMWLRESLPLVIYLWAFLPAIIDLILISSGEHMLRDGTIAGGIAVMWSGNAAVVILLLVAYRLLARN